MLNEYRYQNEMYYLCSEYYKSIHKVRLFLQAKKLLWHLLVL